MNSLGNPGLASARIRERMVERLGVLGIKDTRVLDAMRGVPRHAFVDAALASRAYEHTALPIGYGQSISQPFVVARASELALIGCVDPTAVKVLEIGTGCGYAAAVLAALFGKVISVERLRPLHEMARENLRQFRLSHLRLVAGDGMLGVPAEAPFDVIIAAAAANEVPPPWLAQLRPGGRIVAPIGGTDQRMTVINKDLNGRVTTRTTEAVRFVPLRGGMS